MPPPVLFLLLATLLPLAGFLLLLFVGKRLGSPLAGWIGMGCIVASFAMTLVAMIKWYEPHHGHEPWGYQVRPILRTVSWVPAGAGIDQSNPGFLSIGIYVDSLTIATFASVTLVASIIHIFSIGFMRQHEHFARFFAFLALACFSILGLVLGSTLLQILIFWQLGGLCVYLLSRFPSGGASDSRAGFRVFVVQRIGDCGLLLGLGLLFCKLGNTTLPYLWTTLGGAASGHSITLAGGGFLSNTTLTLIGLSLFCAVIARSAQFPLHLWIADAMQGPAPAGAMICTVTTLGAGVYFLARLFPILTPGARLFIAIIGVVTLAMSALMALAQKDLPRFLGWISASQMGLIVLAVGIGSWVGGLFHLMTYGFAMSLLFLAAGSVVGAMHGERRMSEMGGLWRKLPVTAGAFALAALAIAGTPLLSVHFSQKVIETDAAAFAVYATRVGGRAWGYWLFFALPTCASFVVALAVTRCWMLIFFGKARNEELHARTREHASLWGPLLGLVVPTVIAGYGIMGVSDLLRWSVTETQGLCNDWLALAPGAKAATFSAFDQIWPAERAPVSDTDASDTVEPAPAPSPAGDAHDRGRAIAHVWASWEWAVGIFLGVAIYWNLAVVERLARLAPLRWIGQWLHHGMFFDELYNWTIVNLTIGLSAVAAAIEVHLIHGTCDRLLSLLRRVLRPLRK